jgi:hypothetical protein
MENTKILGTPRGQAVRLPTTLSTSEKAALIDEMGVCPRNILTNVPKFKVRELVLAHLKDQNFQGIRKCLKWIWIKNNSHFIHSNSQLIRFQTKIWPEFLLGLLSVMGRNCTNYCRTNATPQDGNIAGNAADPARKQESAFPLCLALTWFK